MCYNTLSALWKEGEMAQDKIIVRGAREHNLKNITVEIPRDKMVSSSPGSRVRASPALPLIPSLPKVSADTSNRCQPMRANSSARCKNPTWIRSKD